MHTIHGSNFILATVTARATGADEIVSLHHLTKLSTPLSCARRGPPARLGGPVFFCSQHHGRFDNLAHVPRGTTAAMGSSLRTFRLHRETGTMTLLAVEVSRATRQRVLTIRQKKESHQRSHDSRALSFHYIWAGQVRKL